MSRRVAPDVIDDAIPVTNNAGKRISGGRADVIAKYAKAANADLAAKCNVDGVPVIKIKECKLVKTGGKLSDDYIVNVTFEADNYSVPLARGDVELYKWESHLKQGTILENPAPIPGVSGAIVPSAVGDNTIIRGCNYKKFIDGTKYDSCAFGYFIGTTLVATAEGHRKKVMADNQIHGDFLRRSRASALPPPSTVDAATVAVPKPRRGAAILVRTGPDSDPEPIDSVADMMSTSGVIPSFVPGATDVEGDGVVEGLLAGVTAATSLETPRRLEAVRAPTTARRSSVPVQPPEPNYAENARTFANGMKNHLVERFAIDKDSLKIASSVEATSIKPGDGRGDDGHVAVFVISGSKDKLKALSEAAKEDGSDARAEFEGLDVSFDYKEDTETLTIRCPYRVVENADIGGNIQYHTCDLKFKMDAAISRAQEMIAARLKEGAVEDDQGVEDSVVEDAASLSASTRLEVGGKMAEDGASILPGSTGLGAVDIELATELTTPRRLRRVSAAVSRQSLLPDALLRSDDATALEGGGDVANSGVSEAPPIAVTPDDYELRVAALAFGKEMRRDIKKGLGIENKSDIKMNMIGPGGDGFNFVVRVLGEDHKDKLPYMNDIANGTEMSGKFGDGVSFEFKGEEGALTIHCPNDVVRNEYSGGDFGKSMGDVLRLVMEKISAERAAEELLARTLVVSDDYRAPDENAVDSHLTSPVVSRAPIVTRPKTASGGGRRSMASVLPFEEGDGVSPIVANAPVPMPTMQPPPPTAKPATDDSVMGHSASEPVIGGGRWSSGLKSFVGAIAAPFSVLTRRNSKVAVMPPSELTVPNGQSVPKREVSEAAELVSDAVPSVEDSPVELRDGGGDVISEPIKRGALGKKPDHLLGAVEDPLAALAREMEEIKKQKEEDEEALRKSMELERRKQAERTQARLQGRQQRQQLRKQREEEKLSASDQPSVPHAASTVSQSVSGNNHFMHKALAAKGLTLDSVAEGYERQSFVTSSTRRTESALSMLDSISSRSSVVTPMSALSTRLSTASSVKRPSSAAKFPKGIQLGQQFGLEGSIDF